MRPESFLICFKIQVSLWTVMLELPNDLIKVIFPEGEEGLWEPYSF